MINRIIIFLIRRKLGLKKNENFRFRNQNSLYDYYYFSDTNLMKVTYFKGKYKEPIKSSCSLNHLLSDECKIYTYFTL